MKHYNLNDFIALRGRGINGHNCNKSTVYNSFHQKDSKHEKVTVQGLKNLYQDENLKKLFCSKLCAVCAISIDNVSRVSSFACFFSFAKHKTKRN
jgi:hypothetical protein